jgi:alanyl-tRNA synthetase
MKPDATRELFLDFFRRKGHKIVPGIPVVPHGDPTLLFTNAGMNQFKDVFLGTGTRSFSRAADTQKCIRVSGKHNDLEVVGRDGYHHTFFEMLGNWSFGDYFKKEAIAWGWEFLVKDCGLPAGRLHATVFGGDEALGVKPDEEAESLWASETGIDRGRIHRFGREDNFWEMAATGPCGPCSEIHIDLGPSACDNPAHARDGTDCGVNGGCGRFIEIWNLVFIQYNRLEGGVLEKLPKRHVDTGLGFERLVEVMRLRDELIAGKALLFSNYNTELFTPIFEVLRDITGIPYAPDMDPKKLVAYRVIADHIRALCVAIADGIMPDKKKRGSVLRSLLRRSARFGRQTLGVMDPFIHRLVEPVAGIYAGIFPEIGQRRSHIRLVLEAEEKSFARTVERGIGRFRALVDRTKSDAGRPASLDGNEAFRLYHQDGFPKDLIEQMAREEGFVLDEEGWTRAEEEHRKVSESGALSFQFDLEEIKGLGATEFVGYWETGKDGKDGTEAPASILRVIGNEAMVLDRTPFYAESGGQVGDTGLIEGGGLRFAVRDTGKIGDIIIHYGDLEEADLTHLPGTVTARVDGMRRWDTAANHTATHLLHWALRTVLGSHAAQQGSLVRPDYLRFDFTHPKGASPEEIEEIERLVNGRVAENHGVEITVKPLSQARSEGAIALFGEKYGEVVRMISIGDFSRELCGGTHLRRTGQAGYFKILSEASVQSGVRRIVAVTRSRAVEHSLRERSILHALAKKLSTSPDGMEAKIDALTAQLRELRKEAAAGRGKNANEAIIRKIVDTAPDVGGVKLMISFVDQPMDKTQLGEVVDALRGDYRPSAGMISGSSGGNMFHVIFSSEDGINCGQVLKMAAEKIGKKGGGRRDFARTGWKESEGISYEAFRDSVEALLTDALKKDA